MIGLIVSGCLFLNHNNPPTVAPKKMYSDNMVNFSSTKVSSIIKQTRLARPINIIEVIGVRNLMFINAKTDGIWLFLALKKLKLFLVIFLYSFITAPKIVLDAENKAPLIYPNEDKQTKMETIHEYSFNIFSEKVLFKN